MIIKRLRRNPISIYKQAFFYQDKEELEDHKIIKYVWENGIKQLEQRYRITLV